MDEYLSAEFLPDLTSDAKRIVASTHIDTADQSTCKYKREDHRVGAFETQHKDP